MSDFVMKEIEGFEFPYSEDTTILGREVRIEGDGITLKNSISVHPMEATDAEKDGSPSEITTRHYKGFMESGAGLVWVESIAVREDGRSTENCLWLHDENVGEFKKFVAEVKAVAPEVPLIAQLTHSGRYSKPHNVKKPVIATYNPHFRGYDNLEPDYPILSDDELDDLNETFIHAAELAREAGFDGVDMKCCHGYLTDELLSAYTRPGKYGGSYENRTRFLLDAIRGMKQRCGQDYMVASRYISADTVPFPYGFGMSRTEPFEYDLTEPIQLLKDMHALGVNIVDLSVGKPRAVLSVLEKPVDKVPAGDGVDYFNRFFTNTKAVHEAVPEVVIIGSDYSCLRADAPYVAAGALAADAVSMIGFGRMALAYAKFADDLVAGKFDPAQACRVCGGCSKLLGACVPSGCIVRSEEYRERFKKYCVK